MLLTPSPCHKLSHLLGPPPPSSVTYFVDGPYPTNVKTKRGKISDEIGDNNTQIISASSAIYIRPFLGGSSLQSRAVRRRHGVGGGASVNFGRRQRRAAGPHKKAAG